ncbi:chorismate synthase [Cenarchaeum symbiosum A]|uniref:Chorismate synthase n=1 Tax=Cenarchaeum symbiosum (strain A) TaxID=414004 RepID=A0RU38_CENSY|nr:chorismate synthase [Cenarchaeum symbiosum A]
MPGSSIGERLVLTSFGESHGRCVGAVLDGCPAGLELSERDIQYMLDQRRPGQSSITTQRKEADRVEIISGVFRGHTTGAPIATVIWNTDQKSEAYDELEHVPRPGHSDYPAMIKYGKFNDHRGGGRFSGRLTATHVMGGAIARKLLEKALKVRTISYVTSIGKVSVQVKPPKTSKPVYSNDVRCPDAAAAARMRKAIVSAKTGGDSLGGIIESVTTGLPVGLGEPVFGSLESDLSRAIYSIPSVKGVEFGSGFAGAASTGSENNDPFRIKSGKITTITNNSGGILGGLSIGTPITMRVAFKPVSSIPQKQSTVDTKANKPAVLRVKGRHDPCVVPRAPPVVDALVSLVIADHAIQGGFIRGVL